MELTRRGLFGLIGAAAAGRLAPVVPQEPAKPAVQTINLITTIDGRKLAEHQIKYLPRELHFIGGKR